MVLCNFFALYVVLNGNAFLVGSLKISFVKLKKEISLNKAMYAQWYSFVFFIQFQHNNAHAQMGYGFYSGL